MAAVQGFEHRKQTFLAKCDKSSAGEIDEKAREICAEINARPAFFTTSSCAGRAFIWRGDGVKSTECFSRWRVTHDLVEDARAYFDLGSLDSLECAEGSKIQNQSLLEQVLAQLAMLSTWCQSNRPSWQGRKHQRQERAEVAEKRLLESTAVYWLRFEPFILHVCCRDLVAAGALMAAARSVFKNVGLQGFDSSKLIVAIWGDEGLDMPLTGPEGVPLFPGNHTWLQSLVNSRHHRNWAKIDRFTAAVRQMEEPIPSAEPNGDTEGDKELKHFDVVGDIAIVNVKPKEELSVVGNAILKQDRRVKVVAIKTAPLASELRAPAEQLQVIAGRTRSPLMTTHIEFGVRMIIDLDACFFSPRLAGERQRLCQQVQPGEKMLVAFAGCGPEVLQIMAHTEVAEIVAVELNSAAVKCLQRSLQMCQAGCPVEVLEGDIREVAKSFPSGHFQRILAPRPKNPGDGDLDQGDGGAEFLRSLLPLLAEQGVCHWYDFAADWELPSCERTCKTLQAESSALGLTCKILRVAAANRRTIAERQYRVVADFQVSKGNG